jgi:hypothetical protein
MRPWSNGRNQYLRVNERWTNDYRRFVSLAWEHGLREPMT